MIEDIVFQRLEMLEILAIQPNDYDRFVFILRLLGYRYTEIADIAQVSDEAIRKTVKRCVKRARRIM